MFEQAKLQESGMDQLRERRRNILLLTILLAGSLIRIWLAAGTPVYIVYAIQDDALLMKHASSLLQFEWLGSYTENTLTKGTAFPLYILFAALSRIPYTVLTTLFWIAAAGLLTYSLKDLVRNRVFLGLFYLLLIFAPVTSSMSLFQRVYRNSVAGPAALLAATCSIYLFLNMEKKRTLSFVVSLVLGTDLWFVMNLREDGIWLLPFVITVAILTLLRLILKEHTGKRLILQAAVFLVVPWLILAAGNLGISLLNRQHFGVFARNDRTQGAFSECARLFLSADCPNDESDEQTVWVSRKKYEMLIDESPTLTVIRDDLIKGYEKYAQMWIQDGQCDGDFYVWALREGAMYAGVYESAEKAEAFWEQVKAELAAAFDAGRIRKRKALFLSFSARGITSENAGEIPGLIIDSMMSNVLYRSEQTLEHPTVSTGTINYIREVESMTGSYAFYPDGYIENDPARVTGLRMIRLNNFIIRIYRAGAGVIFFGGKAAFLCLLTYWILGLIKKKNVFRIGVGLLIAAGQFLTATLLQFAVSWFCVFMGDRPLEQWWFYGGQGVPFYMAADLLMIGMMIATIKMWLSDKFAVKKKPAQN